MYVTSVSNNSKCLQFLKTKMLFDPEGNSEGNNSTITGMGRNTLKIMRNFYKEDDNGSCQRLFPLVVIKRRKSTHSYSKK